MSQHMKATISNKLIEVTQQSYLPLAGRTSLGGRKPSTVQSIENYQTNQKVSINRARKNIRRLLECNFTEQYVFLTLTFKPTEEIDFANIKACSQLFARFKKRLSHYLKKNNLPNFKYLAVTEFQDEHRQGAIHYHVICNLTEIASETLQELWQYGWAQKIIVTSDVIENEKIAYYLNKGITDPRLNGHKKYFHSRGLKQPITFEVSNTEEFYNLLNECQATLKQDNTYHSPYTGETKFEQYYLKDTKELIKYVQEL